MALSISQSAKNYTIYPQLPLNLVLPAASVANDMFVALVFGNRTNYGFNISDESTETVAPVVTDDKGLTWTLRQSIVNVYQEESESPPQSPPVISPDASGYFLSVYAFTAPVTGGKTSAIPTVSVTDAGLLSQSSVSPPIVAGRPVFDGGIRAYLIEVTGSGTRAYDKSAKVTGATATPGASLITPANDNEIVIEAGVLIDSSAIGLGTGASYVYSSNFPAGSSYFLIQDTVQGTKAASAGFTNPVYYASAVIALAIS